ncbi:hypothetical protein E4U53_000257 [Claviceps sorghi]|nr:hypothetical protein E4U53_000257 [Claviceps sorghi]
MQPCHSEYPRRKLLCSEDEQELSQDEIRTLGMAGSNVSSIDASHSPPRRPAPTQSSARALNSEQGKKRRGHRSSRGVLTLQERTLLESIDESSEDRSNADIVLQFTCSFCGELFPSQLDLNHHIGASHTSPRPDAPRVVHADYGLSEHVPQVRYLTGGRSLGEFFLPPTLGNHVHDDGVVDGWRAAALPAAIHGGRDERRAISKRRLKPSIFDVKLGENRGLRLGPGISTSGLRPAPHPTGFCGNNGAFNCQDNVEQEERKEASQDGRRNDDANKDDDGDIDDKDVHHQQGDYVSSAATHNAEADKKITSSSVLPSLLWSNTRRVQSWASQRMPSIASVISNTAGLELDTPSPLEPAVLRSPLIDDDEPSLSISYLSGDTSPFSERSPVFP